MIRESIHWDPPYPAEVDIIAEKIYEPEEASAQDD
jgi:hypothetical protein